jgi:NAD(P)-dependent dehydrogenase (short-subunit alcohol dehydrogenase family)
LLLQNKTQDIILSPYAMPHKKSNVVACALDGLVPFLDGEIANAIAQPIMYAILFQPVKVDNVHSFSPHSFLYVWLRPHHNTFHDPHDQGCATGNASAEKRAHHQRQLGHRPGCYQYMGVYTTSKFALECLTEAFREEVRPFGVDVPIVEPSLVKTSIVSQPPTQPIAAYTLARQAALQALSKSVESGMEPGTVTGAENL